MRNLLALALLTGCSQSTVTVQFDNEPSGALADEGEFTALTPDHYGLKLIAVYLSEDIDETFGNVGQTALVYLHPDCGGIGSCDVAAGPGVNDVIDDYFEFARPSEEVNADLHAQPFSVPANEWRYIRIEWCKQVGAADSVSYQAPGMPSAAEYFNGNCSTTVAFDEPIQTHGSESIELHIEYDLTDIVRRQEGGCEPGAAESCYEADGQQWLVWDQVPFTPSITLSDSAESTGQ